MEEKSKLFYDDLVGSGYKLPDYETFKTSLQDQTKADAFYKDLSSNGFKLPDFETFYGVFKPAETVQTPVEQPIAEQPLQETESVQYGAMGATGLQRTKDYKPEIGERGALDFLADNAKSLGVGISNFIPNTLETIAVGQSFVQNAIAKTGITKSVSASEVTIPIGLMNVNLFQASNEYREKMEEFLPTDQAQKDSFWGQTFTALGEIVPVILSGFTAGGSTKLAKEAVKNKTSLEGAVKYGKELVSRMGSAQGVLTFSQVASPSYRQAIGDGATEMEATTYALQNALISLPIEMLPIQGMFKRLDQIIPGNKGVEIVKRALIGGTEEGLTEGFQNVYENLSANAIYDANKGALDGIGDAVAVGGTVGAILNGIMTALTGKRIRVKSPEEAEIIDKAIEETQSKIDKVEENNKKVEETVTALENTSERTLNNGATDLEFIENPDGSIELAEDGLTGPDAEAKKLLLQAKYPNIEFQVVDRTNKKDPYAESDFTVIGIPKNGGKYSKAGEDLTKNQTEFLIEGATTLDELEGLKIDNDTDLQAAFESKVKKLTPATEVKAPVIEKTVTKKQNGKAKPGTANSKSPKKKDGSGPKIGSRKGRVPLDERKLRGKEAQAASLTPNTLEEAVLSWFVNKGRLSYPGLKSLFGQRKQGADKSIQGEFNARRSFMRAPEKGGKSIEQIVEEIYNNLPESLTDKSNADPTALKSAVENAIRDNISISQMAERLLSMRGVDSSRDLPPVEDRYTFANDAIRSIYTEPQWKAAKPEEKADFINEYFNYPSDSDYYHTPEMAQELDYTLIEQSEYEDDIDFLSVMTDEELTAFEKGYEGVDFVPEGSAVDIQKQKVKALVSDLRNQINEDKHGIIVDFEQRAKDDIKFFNTLRNLVVEYARLKGLQFNEFIADLEKLLGQKIPKPSREYLKTLWDTEKKTTPKRNVMTENKSLTKDEQVKQGLEEILVAKEREAKLKLERERAKAAEAIKSTKDKGKAALESFENIKNTMIDFIKMDLKDIPVESFTKGELSRILTQISKARTDWSLNLAIDQAYNIFGEAGKKKRIARAKEKATQAKANIKSGKIGVLHPNSPLDQMLRINPKIIPQRIFDTYESILAEVGARKTVLSPREKSELFARVNEVMKEVDNDNSLLNSLKYEYDNYEDKGENFSETIMKMYKDDIITEAEMEFMKLRKSEIQEKVAGEKVEVDPAEIESATDSIIDEISNLPQPGNNFSKDENKIIRFFNSITKSDMEGMSMRDLASIHSLIGNLENGYIPHLAEKFRQRVEGVRNSRNIHPIIQNFKGKWSDVLSKAKAGIKNKFQGESTSSMRERIRMNPTTYIDQSLRNFKNTQFYDSTFRQLSSAYAAFDSDFKTVLEKLLKAESRLKNQFESRSKMMMIAIQEEFESNPGAKVNSAKAWVDDTIADNYSIYTAEAKKKLQEIFDSISTDGELDLKKADKSLTSEEKAARKAIGEINSYLTPIADWTATVIRGNRVPIHENYIHLPKKVKGEKSVKYDPQTMGGPLNPSTKSGALTERTGKTHAISFDILENVLSGAKKTLMDYHMTPVVKEMNETFSHLQSIAKTEGETDAAIQMSKVYKEALTNVIGTTMMEQSASEAVLNEVVRKGYQSILSGAGKAVSELGTNSAFAGIFKLNSTIEGIGILSRLKSDKAASIVKNVRSSHVSRLYNTSGMDSRHVDFGGYSTKKLAKTTGVDEGVISRMMNIAKDNKYYRFIDDIQTSLMSSPDQMVSRPIWMGVFNENFKKLAKKDPDFDKIAANDQDYMEEFYNVIEKSRSEADDVVTEAVASSNPFDGILKNTQAPSRNAIANYLNTFNSFMTRFPIYEYNSAVRGINSLMGNGKMSRADGAKLLMALSTRLMMYDLMTKTVLGFLYQKIAGLFSDQEEEEKEPIENILARPFISSMVMLILNRNMSNVAKAPINYAVELVNKEFGEGITYSGEYDGFSRSVTFPILPVEKQPGSKSTPLTLIENTSASMSPMIKTTFRGLTVGERALTSKTEEARERNINELLTRIPFEVAGNLGYIPAYKDLRKVMLDYWYNAKEEDEKEKAKVRKFGQK